MQFFFLKLKKEQPKLKRIGAIVKKFYPNFALQFENGRQQSTLH